MLTSNTFKIITLAAIFAVLLSGCGATRPGSRAGGLATPSPADQSPERQTLSLPSTTRPAAQKSPEPAQSLPQEPPSYQELTEIEKMEVDQADIEFVRLRLDAYEFKFRHWLDVFELYQGDTLAEELTELETDCVQNLERILNGYSLLLERMQQNKYVLPDELSTVDPKVIQQLDIAFLESRCSELLALDISNQFEITTEPEPKPSYASAQKAVAALAIEGNYQEVIIGYEQLATAYPGQSPNLTTQMNYGLALQYSGQIEAATRHFTSMLAAGALDIEPLSLQREIADLFLASGNIAAAESYYNSIIGAHEALSLEISWAEEQLAFLRSVEPDSLDMIAYQGLLREFQTNDYRIHAPELNNSVNAFASEFTDSPVAASGLRLKTFAVDRLKAWFDRQLVQIDSLVAAKKYTEAIDILKRLTRYYLPAELQAIVQKTYYEVNQAAFRAIETQRHQQEIELLEKWDAAVNLLDTQRYDSAILAFTGLLGTEYEEKAKIKVTEASNQAAGSMRQEAASLFIKAGKTPGVEQKKELLLASHKLLTEILTKYPQTDLLDKVQQNIAILEMQIQRFDPALMEELRHQKDPELPDDSPSSFWRNLQ